MSVHKVVVTRNYQVTLPAPIRKKLGIKLGDRLIVTLRGDKIVMEKPRGDITKIRIKLGRKISWRLVEETVREAAGEVADEGGSGH